MRSRLLLTLISVPVLVLSACALEGGSSNTAYTNTYMDFTITLPSSWYLPGSTERAPHFYEAKKCTEEDGNGITSPCAAFEIQADYSQPAQSADEIFQKTLSEDRKPMKMPGIIPEAEVIRALPEEGAEGWNYEYYVLFQQQKRFIIFSNDEKLEKDILPTFQLTAS